MTTVREIIVGCDNAAVALKETILKFLEEKGVHAEDMGCSSDQDTTYYPTIAQRVCQRIIDSGYQARGILLCGTGIGMCMTANKCKGIRAAVCHDNYSAERSILSNNGNVVCMGARVIGPELAKKIVNEWIDLEFKEGSSSPKVEDISRVEKENFRS